MTADPAPSRPSLWLWLVPLGVAAAFLGGLLLWILVRVPDSGIEIGYRIIVPEAQKADRPRFLSELEAVTRRRVAALAIAGSEVRIEQDLLILRLPAATSEKAARAKRVLERQGRLHLSLVAPPATQAQFNKDKVVPEGYKVVGNSDRGRGPEYEVYGGELLVRREPVIESGHITQAEPLQEAQPGGGRWVIAFEMNAEGAALLDEAAGKLHALRPPGLIAILLDGELKSAPAVQSPSFQGRAQVSGAKDEEDAKDLALILGAGALPLPLGNPEFERRYGPDK